MRRGANYSKELPAMAIPRLHVDNATTGLLRAVIDANTEQILGASLLCRNSPEVINYYQNCNG